MDTQKKPSRQALYIGIATVVAFLAIVAGSLMWVLSRGDSGGQDPSAIRTAYLSAMRKAGVSAPYPADPVELSSVVPSGSHPFSATFTADELAALLSTFPLSVDVDGTTVALKTAELEFPKAGIVRLTARVDAQGTTYSAVMLAPVVFEDGLIQSPGAISATAEGFSLGGSRRAQLTNAVVTYANEYLRSAPGLEVESAVITADGVAVTGSAPDALKFP